MNLSGTFMIIWTIIFIIFLFYHMYLRSDPWATFMVMVVIVTLSLLLSSLKRVLFIYDTKILNRAFVTPNVDENSW